MGAASARCEPPARAAAADRVIKLLARITLISIAVFEKQDVGKAGRLLTLSGADMRARLVCPCGPVSGRATSCGVCTECLRDLRGVPRLMLRRRSRGGRRCTKHRQTGNDGALRCVPDRAGTHLVTRGSCCVHRERTPPLTPRRCRHALAAEPAGTNVWPLPGHPLPSAAPAMALLSIDRQKFIHIYELYRHMK
jgi:hypothetical protein